MSQEAPSQLSKDELIGRVINDRFHILRSLRQEFMAQGSARMYRAEQLPLGRPVAIKTLDTQRKLPPETEAIFRERFLTEASIASRITHPNSVSVFDYGRTPDGIYFMALELIEARSLAAALREDGPFAVERVVHVALQIARALREAHRIGVVHGDLKPASVLLTRHADENDFVKVFDFGMGKPSDPDDADLLAQSGLFLGAPRYMAPEQIRGDLVDARADLYALGVCMYEMLTGRVPFVGENTVKIFMAHMREPVPAIDRSDCPPTLVELVLRCLAKSPGDRPASTDEVIILLKHALGRANMLSSQMLTVSGELSLSGQIPTQHYYTEPPPPPAVPFTPLSIPAYIPPSGVGAQQTGAQVPALAAASVPPQQQPTWLPKLAVAGAIVIAAGFLALRAERREANAASAAALATAAQPAAVAPQASAAPTASSPTYVQPDMPHVRVRLSSSPAGAVVVVDDKRYGPTPADVELWGDQVAPGREVTFVFEKDGYEAITITRLVRGEMLNLDVALPRAGGSYASMRPATAERASEPQAQPARADNTPWGALDADAWQVPQKSAPAAAAAVPAPEPMPAAPAPVAVAPTPIPNAAPSPAPVEEKHTTTVVKSAVIFKSSAPVRGEDTVFPEYPRAARRAGIQGTVVTRIFVKPDGSVGRVDILEGPEVFYDVVRRALMTWRYTPARLRDGTAVSDTHVVRVPFLLN